jgi:Cu(I)/Ag(I) efflux system membrane protein CusA/SilA
MIHALIEWSLKNRFPVLCAVLLIAGWGVHALRTTPVDAIPDLSENQVLVYADWPGRGPQEVEDQITYPLSVNLQGLRGVKAVRANSMFGFSLVTVVFEDRIPSLEARQRVTERLGLLAAQLPAGVIPLLGPDASGLGWVYQYYLHVDTNAAPSGGYDLGRLRSVQDYYLRQQLQSVPGVAEVASLGGFLRQYSVEVNPLRLRAAGLTLSMVMDAILANHLNVGGKAIEENGREFVVRGLGLLRGVGDLEQIAVGERDGVPIRLTDVAVVELGGDFRRGLLDVGGQEAVGGIVIQRQGENAKAVIERVKARLGEIAAGLPPGVTVRSFYDRSELIDRTIATLRDALIEEILLVTLAHVLFLFHFRSILIVTLPLPLSILVSFLLMQAFGITSNLMSLSGIAIAIGVLVDAGIVMTENVIRHCSEAEERLGRRLTAAETMTCTRESALQVGRPIFFAMAIIILAFLPVFALEGQEGKLFHPLAFTKTFACAAATVLAVSVVPVLCSLLVRGPFQREDQNRLMRLLLRGYEPILNGALAHPARVLVAAAALLALAGAVALGLPRTWLDRTSGTPFQPVASWFRGFGTEFMPPLDEGALLFMPVVAPGASLTEMRRIIAWQDRVIASFPEVATVAGKLGRAETPTDPAPIEMIETTIQLKPVKSWRAGMTREALVAELQQALTAVPGYAPGFLQPIENRVLMISTGIRAQLGVKLLGTDPTALQTAAGTVERILRTIPGAAGVAPSRLQGKPYLEIEVDRPAAARWGVSARDILEVVEVGLGGRNVATLLEGRERYPIQVRWQREFRDDPETLVDTLISAPGGRTVPLGQVAQVRRVSGPNEIASENGRLRVFVQANVQGRDLGGFVEEVRRRLDQEVRPTLPEGVTLEYSGEFENLLRARRTLWLIVPVSLLVIFLLLYFTYHDAREAAHVILAVPFALSGSVFFQAWMGYPFSVAVWIGYIALFGIAIQTGMVMVVYLEEAVAKRRVERGAAFDREDLLEAVRAGARLRLRPKVMTVATTVASLLPILWSTRAGAEVMKPLAAPVIGGSLSSLLHILVVTPVIFAWLHGRHLKERTGPPTV